jgi:hypothetical protein
MIRAGTYDEIHHDSGLWVIVDVGLSKNRTTGLLIGDGPAKNRTFAEARSEIVAAIEGSDRPVNLMLEAPTSLAFDKKGNPMPRFFEQAGAFGDHTSRAWNVQPAPGVILGGLLQLRSLWDARERLPDVRIFEGVATFRPRGKTGEHREDVESLRCAVAEPDPDFVFGGETIQERTSGEVISLFPLCGIEVGIAPAIVVPPLGLV